MLRQKSNLGQKSQVEKSYFLGFTRKLLPILDFGVQHWNNAKIKPRTKFETFQNALLCFLSLFFNFRTLVRNFLYLWHNFFILIASASNLVGCCRMQMWKCTATFRFFVFGTEGMIFYMWKTTKTPLIYQQIYFCTFQKICTILV